MTEPGPDLATFTAKERELIRRIAERDGVSEEEAATRLAKTALARRVKKRTGKTPARLYQIKRKVK